MASEIKVDTISEKTSAGGVTIDGLLIKDGGISGDVSLIGTTPTFTIGDAGAEDAALVFDGNAQDFYMALDDSADDLVIGLGNAVGTTPLLSFTEGGAATFKNVGTGDDNPMVLTLQTSETDMAANDILGSIRFQAPDEGTGTDAILIAASIDAISEGDFSSSSNATKLSFKTGASEAAAEKMSLSSAGLLTIADDLVIKDGGTIGVSSDADSITIASNGAVTFSQTPVFPDGSIAVADLDIDGATDIGAAIVDADLFIVDDGAGGTNRKTTASRLKTYVGGGISKAKIWHLDTSLTGGGFITANWDGTVPGNTIGDGIIGGGTPVTESSGVFTFGSTGYWHVMFTASFVDGGAAEVDCLAEIHGTKDNSTYNYITRVNNSMHASSAGGNAMATVILDITDTSNQKVKFAAAGLESNNVLYGHGTYMHTYVIFMKLADT